MLGIGDYGVGAHRRSRLGPGNPIDRALDHEPADREPDLGELARRADRRRDELGALRGSDRPRRFAYEVNGGDRDALRTIRV